MDEALKDGDSVREAKWSESIAVGSQEFVERTKEELAGYEPWVEKQGR